MIMRPHQYTVSGRGKFPLDMLRYDSADFATLLDEQTANARGQRRSVKLIGKLEPTVGRWESFNWTVSDIVALARRPK